MDFRNSSSSDIAESIKYLNTNRNILVRFGHFDFDTIRNDKFIDIRKKLMANKELQLAFYSLVDAYFGTANGPVSFFVNQKKPCLLVSTYPIDFEYPTDPHSVMLIPKLVWNNLSKRYFNIYELLDLNFLKIQNLYNDQILVKNGLSVISPPAELIAKIFLSWQNSILLGEYNKWLDLSIKHTEKLRSSLNLPRLGTIPIEYFSYMKSINKNRI
jgi:putative glycosyltransferase (TIGR04372 family)